MNLPINLENIKAVSNRLKRYVRHTPLLRGDKLEK